MKDSDIQKEKKIPRPQGIYYGVKINGVETNGAGILAITSSASLFLYLGGLGCISAIPFVFLAVYVFKKPRDDINE